MQHFDDLSATNRPRVKASVSSLCITDSAQKSKTRGEQIIRYEPPSIAFLTAMLRNDEAVSAVWDRVVDKWLAGKLDGYQPSKPFRPFLITVLKHQSYDFLKQQSNHPQFKPLDPREMVVLEDSAIQAFKEAEGQAAARNALERISSAEQEATQREKYIFNRIKEDGEFPSTKEVAAQLAIKDSAARAVVFRVRRTIKRSIVQQICDELETTSYGEIKSELADLKLLEFCEDALQDYPGLES